MPCANSLPARSNSDGPQYNVELTLAEESPLAAGNCRSGETMSANPPAATATSGRTLTSRRLAVKGLILLSRVEYLRYEYTAGQPTAANDRESDLAHPITAHHCVSSSAITGTMANCCHGAATKYEECVPWPFA